MTIEVVKTKVFEVLCKTCESTLRYEYKDLKHTNYRSPPDHSWIVCPVCQKDIVIRSE